MKNKRRDFLYRDAKSKLADETDLLEMIKRIRIFKFASDCTLKPRQRDLVNFFNDYKLNSSENEDDDVQLAETSTRPISHMLTYAAGSNSRQQSVRSHQTSELGKRGAEARNMEDALKN